MDNESTAYYAEANRWEADRSIALERSARRAWWVAIGATTLAVTSAIPDILWFVVYIGALINVNDPTMS